MAVGFQNVNGGRAIALVNNSSTPQYVSITFQNLPRRDILNNVSVYQASPNHDGGSPVSSSVVGAFRRTVTQTMYLEPKSVTGVMVSNNVNLLDPFLRRSPQ